MSGGNEKCVEYINILIYKGLDRGTVRLTKQTHFNSALIAFDHVGLCSIISMSTEVLRSLRRFMRLKVL
jgi:hypothetical protein